MKKLRGALCSAIYWATAGNRFEGKWKLTWSGFKNWCIITADASKNSLVLTKSRREKLCLPVGTPVSNSSSPWEWGPLSDCLKRYFWVLVRGRDSEVPLFGSFGRNRLAASWLVQTQGKGRRKPSLNICSESGNLVAGGVRERCGRVSAQTTFAVQLPDFFF